jgi:hypothetical protein
VSECKVVTKNTKASGTKCKKKRELYEKEKQESFCKRARPEVHTNASRSPLFFFFAQTDTQAVTDSSAHHSLIHSHTHTLHTHTLHTHTLTHSLPIITLHPVHPVHPVVNITWKYCVTLHYSPLYSPLYSPTHSLTSLLTPLLTPLLPYSCTQQALCESHDLNTKLNKVKAFLSEGLQVKVSIFAKKRTQREHPLALDETTLRVLSGLESVAGPVQSVSKESSRVEFIFSPIKKQ